MTKVTCSVRFEPEALEKLLGEEAFLGLTREVAGDEPLDDHGPVRRALVVVDGYHVRDALRRRHGHAAPELLVDWLDQLGNWLADRFMTDDHGLEVYVRAWDAHLPDEAENKKAFQSLSTEQRMRFADGRGAKYRGQHTIWLTADWHFTDLRAAGTRFVQSGVDARIASDVIGMALERPDVLFLVTADEDFERALEIAGALENAPEVELLTMGTSQQIFANVVERRWLVHPALDGELFALQL